MQPKLQYSSVTSEFFASQLRKTVMLRTLYSNESCNFALVRALKPSTELISRRQICHGALRKNRKKIRISAAAYGEDPYKILGVPKKADSEQIRRVYKKKLAEAKGDEAETKRIEEAHTSIMMSSFSARLSGGAPVDKNIAYADRAVFFPWRPRLHVVDKNLLTISAAVQGILAAWATLLRYTAGNQPLIAATVAGAALNSWKLNQIFPPPPSGSEAAQRDKQGMKNIIRGVGLAVFATFLGCALSFTVPDAIAAQFGKALPYWFYEGETALISVGTALANFTVTALYR